jgi:ankyrin repeat protein
MQDADNPAWPWRRQVGAVRWLLAVCPLLLPSRVVAAEPCDFAAAVKAEDVPALRGLVRRGCDPNRADPDGELPLHRAVEGGFRQSTKELLRHGAHPAAAALSIELAGDTDTSLLRMLLKHGLPVNHRYTHGRTLLHEAVSIGYQDSPDCKSPRCESGNPAMVRLLLAHGGNPNLQDEFGLTPIHMAIADNKYDVVWLLARAKGANLSLADNSGTTPLHLTARQGAVRLARFLLARGVAPNAPDADGDTPLHTLAGWGAHKAPIKDVMAVAKLLLRGKANLAARNIAGRTPLHEAGCFPGKYAVCNPALGRLLVVAGAAIDSRDGKGRTPLHEAALWGNVELLELLLDKGADANAKDNRGLTPLHLPRAYGNASLPEGESWQRTVTLLVRAGARLGERDSALRPPVWLTIARRRGQPLDALLTAGADVNESGPRRSTPLHVAAYHDEVEVAKELLDKGALVTARDDAGESPLHWAVLGGSTRTVELLLASGADSRAADSAGRTPLDLAMLACNDTISTRLRQAGAVATGSKAHAPIAPCAPPPSHPIDEQLEKASDPYRNQELQRLIRAGVPLASRDKHGRTPLHLVAGLFFLEDFMRLLLDRKANANARDDEGLTPLHFAVGDGREKISRMLISAGADVNATDHRGRPPLHHIPFRNDVHELTVMLLEKGANPHLADRLGRTALHAVCNAQDEDRLRAEILVCHGADPEARDGLGWTASDLAAIQGWLDASPARCGKAWQEYQESKVSKPERRRLLY